MLTVFKYRVAPEIEMPYGAKFLRAGIQDNKVTLWFEVSTETPIVKRHFEIVPTGGEVPFNGVYLDTVFDGPYVWHVYFLDEPIQRPAVAVRELAAVSG